MFLGSTLKVAHSLSNISSTDYPQEQTLNPGIECWSRCSTWIISLDSSSVLKRNAESIKAMGRGSRSF